MSHSPKSRRFEILALAIVVVGILLLVDFSPILNVLRASVGDITSRFSPAVWLGLILIAGGLLLLGYLLRVRFLRSAYWRSTTCPRCGERLHMIHRRWYDRLLSKTVLPHARRYRCDNATCRWTGLRHIAHRSRSS